MCQLKKKKIIALIMAVTVLFMPLLSIYETKQNVNIVHAEEATISAAFFGAVLIMMGITAFMQGNMSSTFSIPETDLITLKDQFAQTLEADATKKAAWMNAQTDYLAGGVAKTMGAAELAKIGVNDIYNQFKSYLHENFRTNTTETVPAIDLNYSLYSFVKTFNGINMYQTQADPKYFTAYMAGKDLGMLRTYFNGSDYRSPIYKEVGQVDNAYINSHSLVTDKGITYYKFFDSVTGNLIGIWAFKYDLGVFHYVELSNYNLTTLKNRYNIAKIMGVDLTLLNTDVRQYGNGYITYNNKYDVINTTTDAISVIPTIPWLDPAIPSGTIVTPAIAAPYAGTVPIDVPITAPIDPPIDEPETPTFPDVLSVTLAILAALTPISAILDNLDLGVGDLTDVIDQGNTAIEDGLDDIIGGITGLTTGILTSIENFFDPPSKDIDWDKLRNIQIFDKFPFSIPADLYFLLNLLASEPVAPKVAIDLNLSFISAGIKTYTYDLSQFDDIAQVMRGFELLGFIFFLLYSSKNLIWK